MPLIFQLLYDRFDFTPFERFTELPDISTFQSMRFNIIIQIFLSLIKEKVFLITIMGNMRAFFP